MGAWVLFLAFGRRHVGSVVGSKVVIPAGTAAGGVIVPGR